MNQFSFVAAINHLAVDSPLGGGWDITDELRISNSNTIAKNILTPLLQREIGGLESREILSGKPYVFAKSKYPIDSDDSVSAQEDILNAYLAITQLFFHILWLHKDNSANFSLGFLQYPLIKSASRISSNGRNVQFTNANGSIDDTVISKRELEEVISSFQQIYGKPTAKDIISNSARGPIADDHRVTRAFYFLDMARNSAYLPEKIAFYCTCFETIVSTDSSELAHKVSERVAVIIASDPAEAMEIYKLVKRAYDTRSKLIHGGTLKRDDKRFRTESLKCDEFLRRIFQKINSDDTLERALIGDSQKIDGYFLEKTFGF